MLNEPPDYLCIGHHPWSGYCIVNVRPSHIPYSINILLLYFIWFQSLGNPTPSLINQLKQLSIVIRFIYTSVV